MKKLLFFGIFSSLFLASMAGAALLPEMLITNSLSPRSIVVFKEGLTLQERDQILSEAGLLSIKRLSKVLSADVVAKDKGTIKNLENDPRVLRVEEDIVVKTFISPAEQLAERRAAFDVLKEKKNSFESLARISASSQTTAWGVERVRAPQVWSSGNTGNPIKVAIIDTGISTSHPDLKGNIKGGKNTISNLSSYNDDNGHGSHVAGIIGALNNSIGVVGVAPDVDLYAVKALNRQGSGYLSDIIEGLDWSVANGMRVVNMSLGTTTDAPSFREAITRTYESGVIIVAAAGNDGGSVNYPAAYPEVIAVGATDSNNQLASWSSRGPEVDVVAPGVSIYSTYLSKQYRTLSGTSMATPHVVGAVALLLNTTSSAYDSDHDGLWDPEEVKQKLQATANDLGAAGFDSLYGWGLVDAYLAQQ